MKKIFLWFLILGMTGCISTSSVKKADLPSISKQQRLKVAVMDFVNKTGLSENDNYTKPISHSLQANLFETKTLRIIERERLESILKELSLSMQGLTSSDSKNLKKIGAMLNADALVFGDLLSIKYSRNKQSIFIMFTEGEKIEVTLSARVVDIETGEVLANCQASAYVKQRNWVAFWFARLGGPLNKKTNVTKAIELATEELAQKIAVQITSN